MFPHAPTPTIVGNADKPVLQTPAVILVGRHEFRLLHAHWPPPAITSSITSIHPQASGIKLPFAA